LNFLDRVFPEKPLNTEFHENPSSGSRVVSRGRTDRHDEFCERALKYSDIDKCFGLYRANINWLVS
jgi:hypothetical protein